MIKDEEIDLTEHRDFRGDFSPRFIRRNGETFSDIGDYIDRIMRKDVFGIFPWAVIPRAGITYHYDGLVALGDKEHRESAIKLHNWGTVDNNSCDCCGRKYIKILWKMDWGLCEECATQIHHKDTIQPQLDLFEIGG